MKSVCVVIITMLTVVLCSSPFASAGSGSAEFEARKAALKQKSLIQNEVDALKSVMSLPPIVNYMIRETKRAKVLNGFMIALDFANISTAVVVDKSPEALDTACAGLVNTVADTMSFGVVGALGIDLGAMATKVEHAMESMGRPLSNAIRSLF